MRSLTQVIMYLFSISQHLSQFFVVKYRALDETFCEHSVRSTIDQLFYFFLHFIGVRHQFDGLVFQKDGDIPDPYVSVSSILPMIPSLESVDSSPGSGNHFLNCLLSIHQAIVKNDLYSESDFRVGDLIVVSIIHWKISPCRQHWKPTWNVPVKLWRLSVLQARFALPNLLSWFAFWSDIKWQSPKM